MPADLSGFPSIGLEVSRQSVRLWNARVRERTPAKRVIAVSPSTGRRSNPSRYAACPIASVWISDVEPTLIECCTEIDQQAPAGVSSLVVDGQGAQRLPSESVASGLKHGIAGLDTPRLAANRPPYGPGRNTILPVWTTAST